MTTKKTTLRERIEAVINDHVIVPDEAFSICCELLAHSDEPWVEAFISAISE